MSKSTGNVTTIREALDEWGAETLLLFFLGGHWRKPIDFSEETLAQAASQAESFRNAFRYDGSDGGDWEELAAALDDDFDTPRALSVMHEWRRAGRLEPLRRALELFGLGGLAGEESAPPELLALGERRAEARRAKEFDEADRLRREIEDAGWEVRDEPLGWRIVRRGR
jgi:cysteinyl-tRNA synthetase